MDRVWLTTREAVKSAREQKETAHNNNAVDRAIRTASDMVEAHLHRRFHPEVDTRYFPWPNTSGAPSYRVWFDEDEVISVTAVISGGIEIVVANYILEPINYGPPYTYIELNLGTSASFTSGDTFQNSLAITGLFGYRNDEETNGALAEALDSSETEVQITDSSTIGTGSIIRVDNERMRVTRKGYLDTTVNLASAMDSADSDQIVDVADGTLFFVDEVLLIDAEKMRIVEIAGNNLIVERQYDGSTLAAHLISADVYAPRSLTVVRGVLGTTAAAHDTATAISRWLPPALVEELCIAEATNILAQRQSSWARETGSSETGTQEMRGIGLKELRKQAKAAHGRIRV